MLSPFFPSHGALKFKEPIFGSWDTSWLCFTVTAVGQMPRTSGALAVELIDLVEAVAVVQAGAAGTLVCVDLTVNPLVTCGETRSTVSTMHRPGTVHGMGRLHQGAFGFFIFTKMRYRWWDLMHNVHHGCPPWVSLLVP